MNPNDKLFYAIIIGQFIAFIYSFCFGVSKAKYYQPISYIDFKYMLICSSIINVSVALIARFMCG